MTEFYWKAGLVLLVYFLIGALGIVLYLQMKGPERSKELWTKYAVYLGMVAVLHSVFCLELPMVTMVVLLMLLAKGGMETRHIWTLSQNRWWLFMLVLFLVMLGIILTVSFVMVPFLYVLVVVFDGFSQIIGQLFGKRKLFPETSPNKTLEGFLGGSAAVVITAFLLSDSGLSMMIRLITGPVFFSVLVIAGSISGDWLASWIKRKNGVKDFSTLIPGHGGIFDRFDAFFFVLFLAGFFAVPVITFYLLMMSSFNPG
jgi:phosphatidate cytidylyltransferase